MLQEEKKQFLEASKLSASVDGFLSRYEGETLFHLARKAPKKGVVVEIGSWKGKSTIWLGKGSLARSKSHIYAIDPHTGSAEHRQGGKTVWTFDAFQKNITQAGLNSLVSPLVKTSVEGAQSVQKSVDFVFIDGAHDYDSVKEDLETWFPKVKNGGIIAFHDSFKGWPGVNRVVHDQVFKSDRFKNVRYINAITFAEKVEKASLKEQLRNRFILLIKKIHEYSTSFPQPFKSLTKRLIWKPFLTRWLKELEE